MTTPFRHEVESRSPEQTEAIGLALGRALVGGELVALHGPMGAGKTCLTRGIAGGLGVDPDTIASPTFVIASLHRGRRLDLAHLDAWRLSGSDELESVGWDELRARSDGVIVLEWAERVADVLPLERVDVRMDHVDATTRSITVEGPPRLVSAWRAELEREQCRTCGATLPPGAALAPFCSMRCRMADLGAWLR